MRADGPAEQGRLRRRSRGTTGRRWLLPALVLVLAGCGAFRDDKGVFVDRSDDYLDSREGEPLRIPEGLSGVQIDDPFPIPPTPTQSNPQFFPKEPPRPSAIYANDNRDEVRIQRLGDRTWLVVPESPTTVWPKLKQFLAENGVAIAYENPTWGRINTRWLNVGQGTPRDVIRTVVRDDRLDAGLRSGRDRLLIRVEPGLRELTSEVLIRHENDAFSLPTPDNRIDLTDVSSHVAQVEADLLNEFGAYIAARVAEQTVSMVAQEISTGVKSALTRDSRGTPVLKLALDEERAWATVGQALNRAEAEVREQDTDGLIYHVTLTEETFTGDKPGWFGRLFGGQDEYELQLKLRPEQGAYLVTVLDEAGADVDRELAQDVLVIIREMAS